jgi:dipeptidyl aminopeptidase/acylaminoacyl peptidase
MKATLLISVILLLSSIRLNADTLPINKWLVSPSVNIQKPAFAEMKNTQNEVFKETALLKYEHHNLLEIFPENQMSFFGHKGLWMEKNAEKGAIVIQKQQPENIEGVYLCTYLWVERWASLKIEMKSNQMLRVWLNDSELGVKTTVETNPDKPGKFTKELKLERGKHKIMVKSLHFPSDSCIWGLSSSIITDSTVQADVLKIETTPTNRKHITHIMHGTRATGVKLSADAKYYTISYRNNKPGGENSESWTEVRRTADDNLVYSFQHAKVSQIQWLPISNRLSYISSVGKERFLYLLDVAKLTTEIVFTEGEELGWCTWSPNEMYLIYSINEKDISTYTTTKQIQGMRDRQPGFKNRSFLHHYDIKTSNKTRLTFGNQSTYLYDISPDSRTLAIGTSISDYTERPFSKQQIYLLNLETLAVDTLWNNKLWGVSVSFSPDGKKILCKGGPSAFGTLGENIGKQKIANNYDNQLYIFDLNSKNVEPITLKFNPSVDDAQWSKADNNIYISTTDKDSKRVYKYDVAKKNFIPITEEKEYITGFSMAAKIPIAVFNASQANKFGQFRLLDLKTSKSRALENLESENYKHVEFGDVEEWNFISSQGTEIQGRVYLPVKFDTSKKYPVIVYYYGGTNPVGRTFAGRYPFNLWAGAGNVVYVLQPSGATGFGQEFSAAHVNNWGITVADEIIEGTKKFLAAHPFANEKQVGCIGASYGGFMTMLLTTRTDIFAAAISHAGISSISSYWGEGYWGYAYSAEATADSYPWNAKDLYVNQSPLFNADKVTTPLLLLTGDSDTNVPPGESIQLYTALKILGKPVELITVKDEDHHIAGYKNRIAWHNTIMAWWDKYLKEQNEWWNELYPAKNY